MEVHLIMQEEDTFLLTEEYEKWEWFDGNTTRKAYHVQKNDKWDVSALTNFLNDILLRTPNEWHAEDNLYVLVGWGRKKENAIVYDMWQDQIDSKDSKD